MASNQNSFVFVAFRTQTCRAYSPLCVGVHVQDADELQLVARFHREPSNK
jgi:hypothetical protein